MGYMGLSHQKRSIHNDISREPRDQHRDHTMYIHDHGSRPRKTVDVVLHPCEIQRCFSQTAVEVRAWVCNYILHHNDVVKWKHFPRYWPFVRGIQRSPVNSPHKGQWRGALMFSLICARINGWVNNGEAGDLRRSRAYYDVTVMITQWAGSLIHAVTSVKSC